VITTKRCPHTGILNFFVRADPHLAVGSVSEDANPRQFVWRCYLDGQGGGVAADLAIAEQSLRNAISRGREPNVCNVN
jgi:ribosomal protein S14